MRADELFGKFRYMAKARSIQVVPAKADGFILDIGGGGEGIIGKPNGKQVVAIDTNEEELEETKNGALKLVMDAAEMNFLPKTFEVCTSFFYIPKNSICRSSTRSIESQKTEEGFCSGLKIPERQRNYRTYAIRLRIALPNEKVETGYGTIWTRHRIWNTSKGSPQEQSSRKSKSGAEETYST